MTGLWWLPLGISIAWLAVAFVIGIALILSALRMRRAA